MRVIASTLRPNAVLTRRANAVPVQCVDTVPTRCVDAVPTRHVDVRDPHNVDAVPDDATTQYMPRQHDACRCVEAVTQRCMSSCRHCDPTTCAVASCVDAVPTRRIDVRDPHDVDAVPNDTPTRYMLRQHHEHDDIKHDDIKCNNIKRDDGKHFNNERDEVTAA